MVLALRNVYVMAFIGYLRTILFDYALRRSAPMVSINKYFFDQSMSVKDCSLYYLYGAPHRGQILNSFSET